MNEQKSEIETDNKLVICRFIAGIFGLYLFSSNIEKFPEFLIFLGITCFSFFAGIVEIFYPSYSHD